MLSHYILKAWSVKDLCFEAQIFYISGICIYKIIAVFLKNRKKWKLLTSCLPDTKCQSKYHVLNGGACESLSYVSTTLGVATWVILVFLSVFRGLRTAKFVYLLFVYYVSSFSIFFASYEPHAKLNVNFGIC